jgi:hypothetical protein
VRRTKAEGKKCGRLSRTGILLLCATFFLICSACHSYDPTLYPGYDVLNPSEEVKKNPLGFDQDGNAIVNEAFMLWVYELKQEIIKLRKGK